MLSMLNNVVTKRIANRHAGTIDTTVKSARVDMAGFDGAHFIVAFDDVEVDAEITVRVLQNDVDSDTGMEPLEGTVVSHTATATDADNKIVRIDVVKPMKRYLQVEVIIGNVVGGTAPFDGIFVDLYGARKVPVTQDGNVLLSALVQSPDPVSE